MSVTCFRSVCRVFFFFAVVTASRPDLGHRWHASQRDNIRPRGGRWVTSTSGHLGTEPSGWSNSGKSQRILIRGQFVLLIAHWGNWNHGANSLQILCKTVTFWKKYKWGDENVHSFSPDYSEVISLSPLSKDFQKTAYFSPLFAAFCNKSLVSGSCQKEHKVNISIN